MSGRKDFLSQGAPDNYVAGLGRGATGFTTRSDLGPAREGPTDEQLKEALNRRAAALGQAPPTAYGGKGKKTQEEDEDEERYADAQNEEGLLVTGNYDHEDEEADQIYANIDNRMDKRRRAQREEHERRAQQEYELHNPKVQQQFAELKRALTHVSAEEWAALPDAGDHTGRNKRSKQNTRQRFYAVPDSVLAGARDAGALGTEVQEDGVASAIPTQEQADGTATKFFDIGAARDKVFKVRLDQASATEAAAGTSTNIDTKGYLTSLNKSEVRAGEIPVGDIKRARVLLESVIKTNPRHGPGWIAAARLEEYAGKIVAARNVIRRGCEMCPKSEDVWIEAIRLEEPSNAKIMAKKAVESNSQSVRLWTEAMNLESVPAAKKRVLRQALDHVPQSVMIWKEAVNLEDDPADAKLLLAKATELVPLSVELWLALARLETPEQAQVVLNKARKAVPTSSEIWIAAARLQEQTGQRQMIPRVMERAVKALARESAMPKREDWIAQAETCEEEGANLTCHAIIKETLGWGLDEDEDRKQLWLEDARISIARGRYETARAIYEHASRVFPKSKSVWLAGADLERSHGTKELLLNVLGDAVKACPDAAVLWMQLAREQRQLGNLDEARRVLGKAFNANPGNEDIWLSAVKLEADEGETLKARGLLRTARSEAGTDRVWIKSIAFERQLGDNDRALALAVEGLNIFPAAAKMWMMKGQIYEAKSMLPKARETYALGTRACPKSVPLWLLASRLEEKMGAVVRARSMLDKARHEVPNNAELWTESVRLELRAKNMAAASQKMAQAMQACPNSGILWHEKIWHLEARTQRRARTLDAIKRNDSDPVLFIVAARIFWGERRLEKADIWFQKALVLDPDYGDGWAWYYKFLIQHGTDEKKAEIVASCVLSDPKHGEVWQSVRKTPENARKTTEEILKEVAALLE